MRSYLDQLRPELEARQGGTDLRFQASLDPEA